MNIIRTWAIGVAAACVIGTVISFLKPDFSASKVLNFMLGTFFIAVILNPFGYSKKIKTDFDFNTEYTTFSYSRSREYLKSMQLNAAAKSVKEKIEQALKKKKFEFSEVEISMNTDKNDSIFISEVVVSGVNPHRKQQIYDYIKKEFKIDCSVRENA